MLRTAFISIAFMGLTTSALYAQTAGLEFMAGPIGSWEADPGKEAEDAPDLAATWGIIPWLEAELGSAVGVGGEMAFLWTKNDLVDGERQLILSPHARLRMSFPLVKKVTFDSFIALGPSIWVAPDDPEAVFGYPELSSDNSAQIVAAANQTRFGWGIRFGFGASYAVNRTVSFFSHLGYYSSTTYGDDVTLEFEVIPLCVGLRAEY